MSGRARWWSFILVAIIVIGLRGPLQGGFGLRAYQSDMVEPGLILVNTDIGLEGVVGAGTMGAGIARVFADAGAFVRLCARRESSLEAARARLGGDMTQVQLTTSAEAGAAATRPITAATVITLDSIDFIITPPYGIWTRNGSVGGRAISRSSQGDRARPFRRGLSAER